MITLGLTGLTIRAAAAAPKSQDRCSWDRPGANPFTGDVVAAVDHYSDIPAPVRAALKKRVAQRSYDEVATIGRNSITGKHRYSPEISDMHFGAGRVCRSVTRSGWPAGAQERGLVYCDQGHCLIVPTVCRNVSRLTRLEAQAGSGGAGSGGGGASGPGAAAGAEMLAAGPAAYETGTAAHDSSELLFEAPSAGPGAGGDGLPTVVNNGALQALSLGLLNSPNGASPGGTEAAATFEGGAAPGPIQGTTNGTSGLGAGAGLGGGSVPLPLPSGSGLQVVNAAPTPAVPEPATAWLWLMGLATVALARRHPLARNIKANNAHQAKGQVAAKTPK